MSSIIFLKDTQIILISLQFCLPWGLMLEVSLPELWRRLRQNILAGVRPEAAIPMLFHLNLNEISVSSSNKTKIMPQWGRVKIQNGRIPGRGLRRATRTYEYNFSRETEGPGLLPPACGEWGWVSLVSQGPCFLLRGTDSAQLRQRGEYPSR